MLLRCFIKLFYEIWPSLSLSLSLLHLYYLHRKKGRKRKTLIRKREIAKWRKIRKHQTKSNAIKLWFSAPKLGDFRELRKGFFFFFCKAQWKGRKRILVIVVLEICRYILFRRKGKMKRIIIMVWEKDKLLFEDLKG